MTRHGRDNSVMRGAQRNIHNILMEYNAPLGWRMFFAEVGVRACARGSLL